MISRLKEFVGPKKIYFCRSSFIEIPKGSKLLCLGETKVAAFGNKLDQYFGGPEHYKFVICKQPKKKKRSRSSNEKRRH